MKHLRTFESNDDRSEMIDKLCEMGYDKSECDAMSYEELCDCVKRESTKEYDEDSYGDTYESKEEEIVQEGLLKALGIKKMSERIDEKLGFIGDDFKPSNDLKIYLSQASERNSLPTTDIDFVEESLRKARNAGYGLSFWKDEPDLSKMQGSEDEKKVAKYLIKRAIHSIHTTSGGGHEFGQKPNITSLKDNTSHSNLKHLKSFESFDTINEEEGKFREFFTGHATKESKEKAKQKFLETLEEAEKALKKAPEDYAQSKNWESTKKKLIDQAEENNYKGGLRVQRGGRDPRVFIVYDEGVSGFQKLATASSGEVNVRK